MNSLRTRLALLSSLVSGLVIVLLGIFVGGYVRETLLHTVDLRLAMPLDRFMQDLHPRGIDVLLERVQRSLEENDDAENRMILFRDEQSDEIIFQSPEGDWLSQIDAEFWQGTPDEIKRARERKPRPVFGQHRRENGEPPPDDENFLRKLLGDKQGPLGESPPLPKRKPQKGRRLGEYGDLPHENRPVSKLKYTTATIDGQPWRFAVVRERGYVGMLGFDLQETTNEMNHIKRGFWISVPLALLLIGGGGWFIANRALQPVKVMTEAAGKITAAGLDERIPEGRHLDAELSELTSVLNGMMDRLEHSFKHATRFSADVSHELKTPLAIMQGEVESALKNCPADSAEETSLLHVQREAQRLKAITGSLMILAQADAGQLVTHREICQLSDEIEAMCEDAEILCEQHGLTLTTEIQRGIELETDSVLLRQALQNLISNAVKYNEADGKVSVLLEKNEQETLIVVANTGSGIPDDERDKIFDRFHRADKARSRNIDGFGLGLNLALEIIRGLGGELSLARATSEMTKFEVRFSV